MCPEVAPVVTACITLREGDGIRATILDSLNGRLAVGIRAVWHAEKLEIRGVVAGRPTVGPHLRWPVVAVRWAEEDLDLLARHRVGVARIHRRRVRIDAEP